MLPTKLANAALRGTLWPVVPLGGAVALIRSPEGSGGRTSSCRMGNRAVPGAVSGAAVQCCARTPGCPVSSAHPHRARCVQPYVPTGYVPDGEVTAVTMSRAGAEQPERRPVGAPDKPQGTRRTGRGDGERPGRRGPGTHHGGSAGQRAV